MLQIRINYPEYILLATRNFVLFVTDNQCDTKPVYRYDILSIFSGFMVQLTCMFTCPWSGCSYGKLASTKSDEIACRILDRGTIYAFQKKEYLFANVCHTVNFKFMLRCFNIECPRNWCFFFNWSLNRFQIWKKKKYSAEIWLRIRTGIERAQSDFFL